MQHEDARDGDHGLSGTITLCHLCLETLLGVIGHYVDAENSNCRHSSQTEAADTHFPYHFVCVSSYCLTACKRY